jgi:hypothetical protein
VEEGPDESEDGAAVASDDFAACHLPDEIAVGEEGAEEGGGGGGGTEAGGADEVCGGGGCGMNHGHAGQLSEERGVKV